MPGDTGPILNMIHIIINSKKTEDQISLFRRKLKYFEQFLPNEHEQRADFNHEQVQYAYITYKNKCHTENGGLTCGKIIAMTEKL